MCVALTTVGCVVECPYLKIFPKRILQEGEGDFPGYSCEVASVQADHTLHNTSQDRTSQDRTGQDRTGQDRTEQVMTEQVRTGQNRSGQDRTGQDSQRYTCTKTLTLYLLIYAYSVCTNITQTQTHNTDK